MIGSNGVLLINIIIIITMAWIASNGGGMAWASSFDTTLEHNGVMDNYNNTTTPICVHDVSYWLSHLDMWPAPRLESSLCMRSWSDVLMESTQAATSISDTAHCLPLASELIGVNLNGETAGGSAVLSNASASSPTGTQGSAPSNLTTLPESILDARDEALVVIDMCCENQPVSHDNMHLLLLRLRSFNQGRFESAGWPACPLEPTGDHSPNDDPQAYPNVFHYWMRLNGPYAQFFYINPSTRSPSIGGIVLLVSLLIMAFIILIIISFSACSHKKQE